jgi:hypothetical protein
MEEPRWNCETCQDWGTVVRPDGHGTIPCPDDCSTAQALKNRKTQNGDR